MKTIELSKINIVLVTDCLAELTGGAEKQIYELSKGLDKNKFNVFVISLDAWGKTPVDIMQGSGAELKIFRIVRIYGITGIIQGFRFFKFLKDNNIKIIVTYHFSSDIWATFIGWLAGITNIFSNRRDMGFWRNNIHIIAYKIVDRWVKKIIVVSESIKQMVLDSEQVLENKIDVIYNGVSLPVESHSQSKITRDLLGLNKEDIVIIAVGDLKPIKGHKYLIEAFNGLTKNFSNLRLLLVGTDELNGELNILVNKLKIDQKVLFLGKRTDVPELLKIIDICVLPSLSEGMSNAILEYMAAAKPVIATNVGGNPELITNGYNGLIVEKENANQLENALKELIQDQGKRQQMGQNGFNRVKTEFAMEAMVSKYDRLFSGIKVLHLISSGGLFGAERVILNLAAKQIDVNSFIGAINNKHNPHLEIINEAKDLGLKTIAFNSHGAFDLRTINEVKAFILKHKIDVIHSHNYKSDLIAFWAIKGTGTKWVATNHGWIKSDSKLSVYENLDGYILRFAKKVIVVSEENRLVLLKHGIDNNKLNIIDNGIPVERYNVPSLRTTLRKDLDIPESNIVISIVGRLAIEKGHDIFLKAAAHVVRSVPHVNFLIIGDGHLKEDLIKQAKELGIADNVIFTGISLDMPAMYACTDILVNASYKENLPMTILEGMASQCAIIATRVGAVGDVLINNESGLLINPGNEKALSEAMLDLINHKEKRLRLGLRAYEEVVARYNDAQMAKQYLKIYNEALN